MFSYEVVRNVVDKITSSNLAKLAMRSIVIAAVAWTSATALSLLLDYSVAGQREANAHQLRLANLERTKITGGGSGAVSLRPRTVQQNANWNLTASVSASFS